MELIKVAVARKGGREESKSHWSCRALRTAI